MMVKAVEPINEEVLDYIDVNKYLLGNTEEEKAILIKATNGVKQTVHVDRKINLGNYETLGIGFTINIPLGMSAEELVIWQALTEEAIQRGVNILNDEMEKRVSKAKAQLKAQ